MANLKFSPLLKSSLRDVTCCGMLMALSVFLIITYHYSYRFPVGVSCANKGIWMKMVKVNIQKGLSLAKQTEIQPLISLTSFPIFVLMSQS